MNFANFLLNKNFIKTRNLFFCIILQEKLWKCSACLVDCTSPPVPLHCILMCIIISVAMNPAWGRHNAWPALWKQNWIHSSKDISKQQNTRCHYRSHRCMLSTDSWKRPEVFFPRKTQCSPLCLTYQTQSPGLFQCPLDSLIVAAHTLQMQNLTLHELSTEIFANLCFQVSAAPCDCAGWYGSTQWIFQGPRIRN